MIEDLSPYRGRTLSPRELDDLILIALAFRDQGNLDEQGRALSAARSSTDFIGNVRKIASAERWEVDTDAIDAAVRRLTRAQMLTTDRDPGVPAPDGCKARLQAGGYARAAAVARDYLGKPLQGFRRDDETFEGIGQVQVNFLGEKFVIGCVEGEEDKAIRLADRFEIDAGEVTKAVTGDLDHTRAMLMAAVLAYERLEEFEDAGMNVPASDRTVRLDHNGPDYLAATSALEQLIHVVRDSNSYREAEPEDQERRLAELEAGRRLLGSSLVSVATMKAAVIGTITYLAAKFIDAPIGEAATIAWTALKRLLHLP